MRVVAVVILGTLMGVVFERFRLCMSSTVTDSVLLGDRSKLKGLVFGAVICLISCYCGFTSTRGPEGVGQATNAAVVASSVTCVSINYLVSQVLYG